MTRGSATTSAGTYFSCNDDQYSDKFDRPITARLDLIPGNAGMVSAAKISIFNGK